MRSFILILLIPLVMSLSSCTESQIRQSGEAITKAEAVLAQIEQKRGMAEAALASARQIAEATNSEEAQKAVAIAQRVYDEADAAIPMAQSAIDQATAAHAAAKAAHEAGGGTWAALIGAAITLIGGSPAIAGAWMKYRNARVGMIEAQTEAKRYETALGSATSLADDLRKLAAMEPAAAHERMETLLSAAKQGQVGAGVHDLIKAARA